MSDIVERLRERPSRHAAETEDQAKERRQREREETADTITTLRAEVERLTADLAHADAKGQENDKLLWGTIKANERLRAALEFYADRSFDGYETFVENYGMTVRGGAIIEDAGAIARAALTQEKPND
jgi:hypothetical protein